jgi:alpha-beta hydrolase superfamily lysophospholipase
MTTLPLVRNYEDAHGIEITFYEWPVAKPRAVIQLVHGLGEHARRYDHVAAALNRDGYSVYAEDHRGHGLTGLSMIEADITKRLGPLGPGGMKATIEQVHQLTEIIRDENPGVDVVLFGHSLGSMIGQRILNKYSGEYDAAILSGSTILIPGILPSDGFNKRWAKTPNATGMEWLSSDETVGQAFAADPLCFPDPAAKAFGLVNAAGILGVPSKSIAPDFPVLLFAGSEDPLGGEKGNKKLLRAFHRAGVRDVTLIVYEGMRHETLNEKDKERVIEDVIDWLDETLRSA